MSARLVVKRSARLCSSRNAGFGLDPGAREQRQRLLQDAALGHRDDDRFGHVGAGFTRGVGGAMDA